VEDLMIRVFRNDAPLGTDRKMEIAHCCNYLIKLLDENALDTSIIDNEMRNEIEAVLN